MNLTFTAKSRSFPSRIVFPIRDVNLRVVADEGDGQSLLLTYSRVKVNVPLSAADLTFETNRIIAPDLSAIFGSDR